MNDDAVSFISVSGTGIEGTGCCILIAAGDGIAFGNEGGSQGNRTSIGRHGEVSTPAAKAVPLTVILSSLYPSLACTVMVITSPGF